MKKMQNLLLVAVFSSGLLIGCSTTKVNDSVQTQEVASQKILNELKNGVSIYFDTNSSEIEAKYQIYLITAAKGLAQNQNFVLELEGHTDSSGSAATNRRVSLERANSIRNTLIMNHGVNPNQVKAFGVGSSKPIDTNATAEGRANNRRVSATLKIQ